MPPVVLSHELERTIAALGLVQPAADRLRRVLRENHALTLDDLRQRPAVWRDLWRTVPGAAEVLEAALQRRSVAPALPPDPVAWAQEAGLADLLRLPVGIVPGIERTPWYRTYGRYETIERTLDQMGPVSTGSRSLDAPAHRMVWDWLQVCAGMSPLPPPPPVQEPSLLETAARLDSALAALSGQVGTPLFRPELTLSFSEPDAEVHLLPAGQLGCRTAHTNLVVRLDPMPGEPVVACSCPAAPPACRARLYALWMVRRRLAEPEPAARFAAAVSKPRWERTLELWAPAAAPDDDVQLGWAVDRRAGVEVRAVRVREARNGTVKTTFVEKGGYADWLGRPSLLPADDVLLRLGPLLHGRNAAPELILVALGHLVGHPRVFDAESRARLTVRRANAVPSLDAVDGAVLLSLRLGQRRLSVADAAACLDRSGVHGRFLAIHDTELIVAEASPDVARLVQVLAMRSDRLPQAALPALLRRCVEARVEVEVAPELGVARVSGSTRPTLRLEIGEDTLLRVTIRTRPHAGTGAYRPGEGPDHAVVDHRGTLLQVLRDPEGERDEAVALRDRLGLDVDESWTWAIDDTDRALDLVGVARTLDGVDLEWAGRRPKLHTATASQVRVQVGRGTDWFGLGGEVDVDGVKVPLRELLAAMRERRTWVRVEGDEWVRVEERLRDRLRALADAADDRDRIGAVHAPVVDALAEDGARVDGPASWLGALTRLHEAAALDPKPPAGLVAELRGYQAAGYAWLTRLLHWAGGAVLADDMGLGKTVQALAVLVDRAGAGPQLVVAPMSVGFNWVREAARFAPGLRVHLHHGADRPDDLAHLGPGDLVVTTYDVLVRDAALAALRWTTLVLDEAQAIKNAETQRAKAATALPADARLALTGTPVENRLAELWSLFAAVVPGLLGSAAQFRGRFSGPVERDGNTERRAALAQLVRPFVLRRVKTEVAKDLPPRMEVRIDVELSPAERRAYDALRAATVAALEGDGSPREQLRFRVLAALTRLRQLACARRLVDETAELRSTKVERLMELLVELRAEGRRVLVFSQFAELLRLVLPLAHAEGLRTCHLDGSTPARERRAEVDRFQAGEADVFFLSLKAGGTGLNLTAASEVILLDPWWNPAVEDQAADRSHRIGQQRAVTIYRLVARGTVEEPILAMHERKRDLAGAVLDGAGDTETLSVDALLALLRGETG